MKIENHIAILYTGKWFLNMLMQIYTHFVADGAPAISEWVVELSSDERERGREEFCFCWLNRLHFVSLFVWFRNTKQILFDMELNGVKNTRFVVICLINESIEIYVVFFFQFFSFILSISFFACFHFFLVYSRNSFNFWMKSKTKPYYKNKYIYLFYRCNVKSKHGQIKKTT